MRLAVSKALHTLSAATRRGRCPPPRTHGVRRRLRLNRGQPSVVSGNIFAALDTKKKKSSSSSSKEAKKSTKASCSCYYAMPGSA